MGVDRKVPVRKLVKRTTKMDTEGFAKVLRWCRESFFSRKSKRNLASILWVPSYVADAGNPGL